MNLKKQRNIVLILIFFVFCGSAFAQEATEKFGKNRVQYKNFKWRFYSTENFDIFIAGHTDNVNSIVFSPDGKLLASGGHDNNVVLWNAETGQLVNVLEGHVHRVRSVAFHPEGKILASGSYDTNILLWDVERGGPIGPPLLGHTNDVNSIAWSPDGNTLVSGSWDDMVILWDINFDSWHNRACHVANRDLTEAEWNQFIGSDYPYRSLCKE